MKWMRFTGRVLGISLSLFMTSCGALPPECVAYCEWGCEMMIGCDVASAQEAGLAQCSEDCEQALPDDTTGESCSALQAQYSDWTCTQWFEALGLE